jgi:two-component system, NtrC family, response regulator AtoC
MPDQKQHRALFAVNDEGAYSALRGYFRSRGDVAEMTSGTDLLAAARSARPCFILLEAEIGDRRLEWLRRDVPEIPIVAIVPPTADSRFEAARCGVAATLVLPLTDSGTASSLSAVLRSLSCDCQTRQAAPQSARPPFELPGLFNSNSSPRMMEIRDLIDKVANTSAPVLIRGETGVGKEIAARMIFRLSERREKPFVKVACAAIPNDLLESELFGYEAGAFTGAHRAKPGKFELADGGTVFLDEIAEMHPALQAKLLHVLQDGEFSRLGSKHDTSVNVRVICATNRQIEARVAEGLFREDLLYRINVVTVNIPPLRERRSEIPSLIRYFLAKYSALYGRNAAQVDGQTLEAMIRHHWPGNIRELENFCKRYVIVGDASSMMRELQPRSMDPGLDRRTEARRKNSDPAPASELPVLVGAEPSLLEIGRQAAWRAERQAIENMLVTTHWNRREAARRLQVSYKALLNKIKLMEH